MILPPITRFARFLSYISLYFSLGTGLYSQNTFQIQGKIFDSINSEILPYATLTDGKGNYLTTSDTYGKYVLSIPDTVKRFIVSYIGYQSKTILVEKLKYENNISVINIALSPSSHLIEEVVVYANKKEIQNDFGLTHFSLNQNIIDRLPSIVGEKDLLKSYQILPGVQSNQEGFSALEIRGGSSDQVVYYIDGVKVYNVSHLFGFLSTFNPASIKYSKLYKGGIPAHLGGGISGAMEIITEDGNKNVTEVDGKLGIISSSINASGPIIKDKVSYHFGLRKTLLDLFMGLIDNSAPQIGFYDFNGKVHFQNEQNTLQLTTYLNRDKFQVENSSNSDKQYINWGNQAVGLRWTRDFGTKLLSAIYLNYSHFEYFINSENSLDVSEETFSQSLRSGIEDFNFIAEMNYRLNNKSSFKAGIKYSYLIHDIGALTKKVSQNSSFDTQEVFSNNYEINGGFSRNDKTGISFYLGLRSVIQFVEEKQYHSIEPRFSMSYPISQMIRISASGMMAAQLIHKVSSNGNGFPADLWIPSTSSISPQRNIQFDLGLGLNPDKKWSFEIGGFFKNYSNVIGFRDNSSFFSFSSGPDIVDFVGDQSWENQITSGTARTFGGEFLFNFNINEKQSLLSSYTLSWAKMNLDGVNQNRTFWSNQDKRHDFLINYNYKFSNTWILNLSWNYATGRRTTIPIGSFVSDYLYFYSQAGIRPSENSFYEVDEINNHRLSHLHRLDFSIRKVSKKNNKNVLEFGLYNAYNRTNPFYIKVYNNKAVEKGLFPVVPSISYQFNLL